MSMKFSTRGEYGLRATVNLARCYPLKKSIKEISKEENISAKYLERLFSELKEGGILKSLKGKNGGYFFRIIQKRLQLEKSLNSLRDRWLLSVMAPIAKN